MVVSRVGTLEGIAMVRCVLEVLTVVPLYVAILNCLLIDTSSVTIAYEQDRVARRPMLHVHATHQAGRRCAGCYSNLKQCRDFAHLRGLQTPRNTALVPIRAVL